MLMLYHLRRFEKQFFVSSCASFGLNESNFQQQQINTSSRRRRRKNKSVLHLTLRCVCVCGVVCIELVFDFGFVKIFCSLSLHTESHNSVLSPSNRSLFLFVVEFAWLKYWLIRFCNKSHNHKWNERERQRREWANERASEWARTSANREGTREIERQRTRGRKKE